MERKPYFGCPIKATSNALAGKWKVMIVWLLSFERMRFSALRNELPGVSEKVLTEQLRQLETDGIVQRTELGGAPLKVEYSLTAAGEELVPILETMCAWATTHLGVIPNLPRRTHATEPA